MLKSIAPEEIVAGSRFLLGLPAFLRRPITLDEARARLRQRLERREAGFLTVVESAIYGQARSPYLRLLRSVGCEYGDLQALVRHEGLEGALSSLFRRGVYLTCAEFKGRQPVVRGSTTLWVRPADLLNPANGGGLRRTSGGSTGSAVLMPMDLRSLADRLVIERLFATARNAGSWRHAIWAAPGSLLFAHLRYCPGVAPPERWFPQVDPRTPSLHPRYQWGVQSIRLATRLAGLPVPLMTTVSLEDPGPVLAWVTATLRAGQTPHLETFVTPAVRLCQQARREGIDLSGTHLTLTGEPCTPARRATIQRSGAELVANYRGTEPGAIGYACLAPAEADEVHHFHDLLALIQPGPAAAGAPGLTPGALVLTSLRPVAPMILLNVSFGDEAVVEQRACGCPLEALGWRTHLHSIRSFEKLTSGGVTFLDTDVIRALEEVLPARFGGGPTDYQLVEEEAADGQPTITLLVHPAVGPLDPAAVAEALLAAIGAGGGSETVWAQLWRQGSLLRVQRAAPHATERGKILHLHRLRAPARGRAPAAPRPVSRRTVR